MNPIIEKQKTQDLLTLASINNELIKQGYRLSTSDIKALLETQKKACQLYHMIDFESKVIFHFAQLFQYSPYVNDERFVPTLQQALYVYYDLQSRLKHTLYDQEVCSAIYEGYLKNKGDFSTCREKVFTILKEQEVTYARTPSNNDTE